MLDFSSVDGLRQEGRTSVAVLMACHNRRAMTLASLEGLRQQVLKRPLTLSVVVVDDGSTDGTAAAISAAYPEVRIVHADGSLFWSKGMAAAQGATLRHAEPDFLLWLNDDVILRRDALQTLLGEASSGSTPRVVVGACTDGTATQMTYSGYVRGSSGRAKDLKAVLPQDGFQRIDTFNGNVVLVPREVYSRIGSVDTKFVHGGGDIDYGYRVARAGYESVLAAPPVGRCDRNPDKGSWRDTAMSRRDRLRVLFSRKGVPLRANVLLERRHGSALWPLAVVGTYGRCISRILASPPRREMATRTADVSRH